MKKVTLSACYCVKFERKQNALKSKTKIMGACATTESTYTCMCAYKKHIKTECGTCVAPTRRATCYNERTRCCQGAELMLTFLKIFFYIFFLDFYLSFSFFFFVIFVFFLDFSSV